MSRPVDPLARTALVLLLCAALLEPARDATAAEFQVANIGPTGVAELDLAIEGSNASPDDADDIVFLSNLDNLTLLLERTPTAIDGGAGKTVLLDGSNTVAFLIRPDVTRIDPDEDFVLLEVLSGQATLQDLNIGTQGIDPDGDGKDLVGVFRIGAGAALAFDSIRECVGSQCLADATFVTEDIRGEGRLVKLGQHTLILTGTNDYAGGTEVREGELRGIPDALPGNFVIERDARLVFEYSDTKTNATYDGKITGMGAVAKNGAGTLEIVENPDIDDEGVVVTGGTSVLQGKLIATTKLIGGNVSISSGATFELLQAGLTGEYFENISGAGTLRKTGDQELRLSGDNSFTGGLAIAEGQVTGDSRSIPGDVTFETAGTTLRFEQDSNGTHDGLIRGPGTLEKDGAGTLTLAGISTHQGGTFVYDGTLRGDTASLISNISLVNASAAVDFSLSNAQTFDGLISGPGQLRKSGVGVLVLNSPQSYTGDTRVNTGVLRLDTDLANLTNVFVGPNAELVSRRAFGSMAGNLDVTGTLTPGGLTDVFFVAQDVSLGGGASLRLELDELGQASSVLVGGDASIDGLALDLVPEPGTYQMAVSYDALEAQNISVTGAGISGTTLDFAFLSVSNVRTDPAGGGREVLRFDLQADVSNIDQFALTPNQVTTANATEQMLASGTSDSQTLLQSFSVLTRPEVPFVLDQLEGETLSAFTTGRITNAEVFDRMIARRFSATEYERGRPSHLPSFSGLSPLLRPGTPLASFRAAPSGPAVAAPAPDLVHGGSIGAWLVPFAVFGDQNGRRNASDMTTRLYGVSGGVDYRLPEAFLVPHSERVRIGLGLGYTRSSLENDRGGLMTGSGNIIQTALYGGYRSQHLHVGLAGRYAYSDLETQRHIVFQAIDRLASADFTGNEAGAFVELGGHFGDPKRLWLHPLASFQYDHLSQDEFRETGAGDLSLGVNGATWDSMQLTVGARISRVFTLRGEFGLEPEIRGGYIGEFGDTQRPVRSRFWAVPGATPFVTAGAPADESTGWVGMGYVMSVASVPLLSLEYDAYLGEHVTNNVIRVGLFFRW